MRQLRFHHVAVAAVLFTLAACGEVVPAAIDAGGDDQIDAAVDPCAGDALTVDEFFVCLSRGVCTVYEDCIGSDTAHLDCADLPINVFGGLQPTALKVVIADAVAAGRTTWDPVKAKECVGFLTNQGCGFFKNNGDPFAACEALVGAVTNGQACQNDIECATPGARCVRRPGSSGNDQCVDFVCQAPVPAGTACTNGAFCLPGDHCVRKLNAGNDISACATGAAGQMCDRDQDCDRGFFCNGGVNDGSAIGICTAAKAEGLTCRTDEECSGELACVGNIGAANGNCRNVRTAGAPCDTNSFSSSCYGHQACETPTAGVGTGTCKPAPDAGAACGIMGGTPAYCGFFLACDMGTCVAPGGVGATCGTPAVFGGFSNNPNGCNLGLFCDTELTGQPTGTCRVGQPNGAQCASNRHCESETCTNMVCTEYPTCTFP